jgi:hypothetical protein
MKNEFVVLILTHGRPDRIYTYDSLRKHGYTGTIRIVIDNEDKTAEEYHRRFPGEVVVFDKDEWASKTDAMDNFPHKRAIVYARNAAFQIARDLGYEWFFQFDDDYTDWLFKFDGRLRFKTKGILSLDEVFNSFMHFAKKTSAFVSPAQGGDFIGGGGSIYTKNLGTKRKCMNGWLCKTSALLSFCGHLNEDCTAYVLNGLRGVIFMQTYQACITQKPTQATAGGMTEAYKESGTYQKSFYTVMAAPSCTKINTVTPSGGRLHHSIKWNNCAPKILRESIKKNAQENTTA